MQARNWHKRNPGASRVHEIVKWSVLGSDGAPRSGSPEGWAPYVQVRIRDAEGRWLWLTMPPKEAEALGAHLTEQAHLATPRGGDTTVREERAPYGASGIGAGVTDDQVVALRDAAAAAGDDQLVSICQLALGNTTERVQLRLPRLIPLLGITSGFVMSPAEARSICAAEIAKGSVREEHVPYMCRRGTEESARALAQERSKEYGRRVAVIESPERDPEAPPKERYVIEDGDGGMIRMWERLVAVYENGKEVKS